MCYRRGPKTHDKEGKRKQTGGESQKDEKRLAEAEQMQSNLSFRSSNQRHLQQE
jgi:hypothetical protein